MYKPTGKYNKMFESMFGDDEQNSKKQQEIYKAMQQQADPLWLKMLRWFFDLMSFFFAKLVPSCMIVVKVFTDTGEYFYESTGFINLLKSCFGVVFVDCITIIIFAGIMWIFVKLLYIVISSTVIFIYYKNLEKLNAKNKELHDKIATELKNKDAKDYDNNVKKSNKDRPQYTSDSRYLKKDNLDEYMEYLKKLDKSNDPTKEKLSYNQWFEKYIYQKNN